MIFENKTILLTGASTGIGRELAIKLSSERCKLILVARRIELLEQLINENSPESSAEILLIKCDVSNKEEVAEAYKQIIDKFMSIDIAILNAGYAERMTVQNYNSELAEKIFGANVF